jgi:hypothetical protein
VDSETFERLAAGTRLGATARRMARRILVDGVAASEAARDEGLSRGRAYDAVARITRELRAERGYPSDWQAVTVVVPPAAADEVREIARRAHRRAGLQVD